MSIIDAISQGFRFFAEIMGWVNKRTELNNSPEMKDAKKAELEQKLTDRDNEIVKNADKEAMRNGLS